MRLNLGCGHKKRAGWVNVDRSPLGSPDQVVDLEDTPWPWADDSVDEVLLSHVLEHLGADTHTYLSIWKELYRICKGTAEVHIMVPHPRSDDFLADPTHVRPILPAGIELFSQAANRRHIANGAANTPLGLQLGIDFELVSVDVVPAEFYANALREGQMSRKELMAAGERWNNVFREIRIRCRAVKPAPPVEATCPSAAMGVVLGVLAEPTPRTARATAKPTSTTSSSSAHEAVKGDDGDGHRSDFAGPKQNDRHFRAARGGEVRSQVAQVSHGLSADSEQHIARFYSGPRGRTASGGAQDEETLMLAVGGGDVGWQGDGANPDAQQAGTNTAVCANVDERSVDGVERNGGASGAQLGGVDAKELPCGVEEGPPGGGGMQGGVDVEVGGHGGPAPGVPSGADCADDAEGAAQTTGSAPDREDDVAGGRRRGGRRWAFG